MKKILQWSLFISVFLPTVVIGKQFSWYGFVQDGSGSYNTMNERVYEYGEGNDNHWNYCIHAATAGALNIRLGENKVTLEGIHQAFSLFSGYGDHDNRSGSLSYVRQLSFSNGKIPDMKAVLRRIPYGDEDALYRKIKEAVKHNNPVVVAAKKYNPVDRSGKNKREKSFSAVRRFKGNIKHGLLITGYLELDQKNSNNNLIMIRDPWLKEPLDSSRYKKYYDYTIPIEILKKLIQNSNGSYHLMLFKTRTDADLKMLVSGAAQNIQPGDSCGDDKIYDCVMTCVDAFTAERWTDDGYCDDGRYASGGVNYNLVCPAFNYDGDDCD